MELVALIVIAILANLVFWGGLIYVVVRLCRSGNVGLATGLLNSVSGTRSSDYGPAGEGARQILIDGGVDPDG